MPAEIALAYKLEHDDYLSLLCGSLDLLSEAFAELDRNESDAELLGVNSDDEEQECLDASPDSELSPADRQIIRTDGMDRRIGAEQTLSFQTRCLGVSSVISGIRADLASTVFEGAPTSSVRPRRPP